MTTPGCTPTPCAARAQFCVLSSSSGGNCSVLLTPDGPILLDAGLSPRRTRALLSDIGINPDSVRHALLTHLDKDHIHDGWGACDSITFHIHRNHRARAMRSPIAHTRTRVFDDAPFEVTASLRVDPLLVAHDDLGVVAMRIEYEGAQLGLATDTGRVTAALCKHLHAVSVLAIESNYCPILQTHSDRPQFLKDRIMGGRGHLSNAETAQAVAHIAPTDAVVLLHLSRQCNRPEIARRHHDSAPYNLVVASHDKPTPWVPIPVRTPRAAPEPPVISAPAPRQPLLWG